MASTQALSNAAQDRKARLAQLKSLKRKQPDSEQESADDNNIASESLLNAQNEDGTDVAATYLSGRNYDAETKGAKLGFEIAPSEGKQTLERQAELLAEETRRQAAEEEQAEKPLDLFQIQPKKPNWDLKRDLDRKLDILNTRTDNAIARMVRERISNQQKAAKGSTGDANGKDGAAVGMEGASLVEATNVREREDEEEARKEREEEEEMLGET